MDDRGAGPQIDAGYDRSYTRWVKTAISLPDELFEEVERTAERLGISRSELFARAARAYLDQHSPDKIRRSYDQAYQEAGHEDDQRLRREAARAVLSRVEW